MNIKQWFKGAIVIIFTIMTTSNIIAQNITIKNRSNKDIHSILVEIPAEQINLPIGNYIVTDENNEVAPVEIITDLYGNQKVIFPIDKISKKSNMKFSLTRGSAIDYPKRTYAELAHKIGGEFEGNRYEGGYSWVKPNKMTVDGSFRDHAYYIKYEGPGWESDMTGFRFYLDQRNAIDVYGKLTPGISLPAVGVDGYDNYHNMADWGMDILKVGKALGLGSIAIWDGEKAIRVEERDSVTCYIPSDGKIRSQVMTKYYGWDANGTKCDLDALISIDAGSRASHMELHVDKEVDNLTTGIIKDKRADLILPEKNNRKDKWSYIATFGKQSLNSDMMGLAIFYRKDQLIEVTEDEINHLVILNPTNGYVEYYFMPTWELDWKPVKDIEDFKECIEEMLDKLNNPVTFSIK